MKITKIYSECPKCKGTGKILDHEDGIFTFGIAYLFQMIDNNYKKTCNKCNGGGKIKTKIIVEY